MIDDTTAAPTPPLPHAAADTAAAEAGAEAGERVTYQERIEALTVRPEHGPWKFYPDFMGGFDAARADAAGIALEADAECERLRAAGRKWRADNRVHIDNATGWRKSAVEERARAEAAEAERDRLSAENVKLGAALEAIRDAGCDRSLPAGCLRSEHREVWVDPCPACRARAALATATPTPPAAEAGTGGWTREAPTDPYGEYWIKMRGEDEPTICDVRPDPLRVFGYCIDDVELWGPELAPPDGWREALAALDTPREATDGE